MGKHR